MARVILQGSGPIAALAQTYFDAHRDHEVVAFASADVAPGPDARTGLPVIHPATMRSAFPPREHAVFIVPSVDVSAPRRLEAYARALDAGYDLVSYVSPSASLWPGTSIGRNCFILERVVLQPWVELADDVTLWSGCHIGHESVIGEHCFLAAGALIAGQVTVGPHCYVGANSSVRNSTSIGEGTWIGPGVTLRQGSAPREVFRAEPSASTMGRP